MSTFKDFSIGEFFEPKSGSPRFIKDYVDRNPGIHPVYSASLAKPFGMVNEYDYEGRYLSWVMNGYGGRVSELDGRFSASRDRGIFVPKKGLKIPDLTYLRFVMEPQLKAAAVGRRVDGKLNEYTKIYPDDAKAVVIQLPVNASGELDFLLMELLGKKFKALEAARNNLRSAKDALARAQFALVLAEPKKTIPLSESKIFKLTIGERVLLSQHVQEGIPAYSANVRAPFARIKKSNLSDFSSPSLLWGIDGNFDWNLIEAGAEFATTDHCGRLQILDPLVDPEYVYWYLRCDRFRPGFDRVFRASLGNMKAEVHVEIPLSKTGKFCLKQQRAMATVLRSREAARQKAIAAIDEVLRTPLPLHSFSDLDGS